MESVCVKRRVKLSVCLAAGTVAGRLVLSKFSQTKLLLNRGNGGNPASLIEVLELVNEVVVLWP